MIDSDLAASLARELYRRHVIFQPVSHVAVLLGDRAFDPGARFSLLNGLADLPQQRTLCGEAVALEVACPFHRYRFDALGWLDHADDARAVDAFGAPPAEPRAPRAVAVECKQSRADFASDDADPAEVTSGKGQGGCAAAGGAPTQAAGALAGALLTLGLAVTRRRRA
jgi:hypothetical protein